MNICRSMVLLGVSAVMAAFVVGCCMTEKCSCRVAGRYAGAASCVAPKHVIVVGFDGLAAYAVTNPPPAMRRMMADGAGTLRSRSILPSSSALNWHSFFTCSASEQHGYVSWNSSEPKFPAMEENERGLYPDIFSEFRKLRPDAEAGLFYEWDGILGVIDTNACSMVSKVTGKPNDVDRICAYIAAKKPAFLAIGLSEPDHAGHTKGWGSPEYMAAVLSQDGVLAKVLETVEHSGMADETVVMLFSDHGGINKGHGGPSLSEMERPAYVWGKGVRKGYEYAFPGAIYDDGATVAALLGIVNPPASWIGRPRHDAFDK